MAARKSASKNGAVSVSMEMDRDTKNTIRFAEVVNGPLDVPQIGVLYVPKATLAAMGFEDGHSLLVSIALA